MSRAGRWAGRALMVLLPLCALLLALSAAAGQAAAQAPPTHILINELLAKSLSGLTGADGTPCEWVELYNPTDQDIDLTEWGLSDKKNQPYRFSFPNCTLAAGEYLVVYLDGAADTAPPAEGLHAAFRLDGSGGHLYLTDADGERVDSLAYPEQSWDVPYGRLAGEWERLGCFSAATPGAANPMRFWGGEKAYADSADVVEFSAPAGCYDQEFTLYLSTPDPDALIVYTLDGSDPDLHSSVYTAAGIPIQSRAGEPNQYLTIPVSSQYDSAYDYGAEEVYKGRVVRARLYEDGQLGAEIFTASYFIRPETSLPVISLVSDPEGLFDARSGIMVSGVVGQLAARTQSTLTNQLAELEVAGSWERFDGQTLSDSQSCTVSLAGGASRYREVKKSFHVTLADGTEYKLRGQGGGESFVSTQLNALWNNHFAALDVGASACELVTLFLDGEYWGVYSLQRTALATLEECSGQDKKDLQVIKTTPLKNPAHTAEPVATAGGAQALADYLDFYQQILARDFSDAAELRWLERQADLDEFIRYLIAELFVDNQDWVQTATNDTNNVTVWRSTKGTQNSRWRWQLYDLDMSTSATDPLLPRSDASHDSFYALLGIPEGGSSTGEDGTEPVYWQQTQQSIDEAAAGGPNNLTVLLARKLWCSSSFRQRFWSTLQALCGEGGLLSTQVLLERVDAHYSTLAPEIDADLARCRTPLKSGLRWLSALGWDKGITRTRDQWEEYFALIRTYVADRPRYMLQFCWFDQPHSPD